MASLTGTGKLPDEELLQGLDSVGLSVSRLELEELAGSSVSARELTARLIEGRDLKLAQKETDWARRALAVLWERWVPARPSLEMLNQRLLRTVTAKAGRNQPCPCGSGRKYKKCCGA